MSNMTSWPDHTVRRLNLGKGGGGGKMEYLFGAALALIIIAAVVLALTGKRGPQIPQPPEGGTRYTCSQCGEVFALDIASLPPEQQGRYGPQTGMAPPCPKCGAQNAAMEMVCCPKCQAFYVSQVKHFDRLQMLGGAQGLAKPQDICPECQTDRIKWYAEHLTK
jgi:hypothetical protein